MVLGGRGKTQGAWCLYTLPACLSRVCLWVWGVGGGRVDVDGAAKEWARGGVADAPGGIVHAQLG
jgi:hypothetical protein